MKYFFRQASIPGKKSVGKIPTLPKFVSATFHRSSSANFQPLMSAKFSVPRLFGRECWEEKKIQSSPKSRNFRHPIIIVQISVLYLLLLAFCAYIAFARNISPRIVVCGQNVVVAPWNGRLFAFHELLENPKKLCRFLVKKERNFFWLSWTRTNIFYGEDGLVLCDWFTEFIVTGLE